MAEPAPALATIGHNQPDLATALHDDHGDLLRRRDELIDAAGRAPATIEDDVTAGKVADFVKQITAAIKASEAKRVDTKEPFLLSGRIVDGFFKSVSDPLTKAKKDVESRLTVYQRKKADDERRAREAAERKAREEAEAARRAAEEAAAKLEEEADLDSAIAAEEEAKRRAEEAAAATKAAHAKAAEMSRSRGEYGSVASLRTHWTFEIEDVHQIPLEELRPYLPVAAVEQAIRGYVKANRGTRPLRGVRIFETHSTVVS